MLHRSPQLTKCLIRLKPSLNLGNIFGLYRENSSAIARPREKTAIDQEIHPETSSIMTEKPHHFTNSDPSTTTIIEESSVKFSTRVKRKQEKPAQSGVLNLTPSSRDSNNNIFPPENDPLHKELSPEKPEIVISAATGEMNKTTSLTCSIYDDPCYRPQDWSPVTMQKKPFGDILDTHLQLSKSRLTALVTATALGGYLLSPFTPLVLTGAFGTSLVSCLLGTALMSSGANAFNQLLEAPYDAQMKRTQARVLVLDRVSPLHAALFGTLVGVGGFSILLFGCNPLTAFLGFTNVLLYAGVYTPLKRHSVGCTWAGALVGAIPPLMGYSAAVGHLDAGALVLAAILYAWQFPHFNGLSWNLRSDYSRAGYRVMCVVDEKLCRRTTLRYSLGLIGLCSIAVPLTHLASWDFAVDSLLLNGYMTYLAYNFYAKPNADNSRSLFHYSLFYLPMLMMLMFVSNFASRYSS